MNVKWTPGELAKLRQLSKTHTDAEICKSFAGKFTLSAVTKQRQRLRIRKSKSGRPKASDNSR